MPAEASNKFQEMLQVRGPAGFIAAIRDAAERDASTVSAYVRSAVIDKLRRDGASVDFSATGRACS